MISNQSWVGAVDHRISAAIVFFVLMLLLNTGKKHGSFPLRAGVTLAVMCLSSWLLRSMSDEWLTSAYAQALCCSAQIMARESTALGIIPAPWMWKTWMLGRTSMNCRTHTQFL